MVVQQPGMKQEEAYPTPEFEHGDSVICDLTRRVKKPIAKVYLQGKSGARNKANFT